MAALVTSVGNAGFQFDVGSKRVYIDALFRSAPTVGAAPILMPEDVERADVFFVTHAHWDHFDVDMTAEVARHTGATVVGPRAATLKLESRLPSEQIVTLEPAETRSGPPATETATVGGVTVTALRTFHARGHNSYLLEFPGFRAFHDGDNEHTDRIPVASLGRLDALFLGPWQGSHWVEFIEALAPPHWFLMHLTEEELDQQARGEFLSGLCNRVPPGLVTLRPGESFSLR